MSLPSDDQANVTEKVDMLYFFSFMMSYYPGNFPLKP